MISQNELSALLANLESDRIERTISTNDTNKFSKAICAFANDMPDNRVPGYLIIGANDDGTLAGLTITDQNLRTLSDQRDNGKIQPIPAINIKKFSLTGGEVAVVEVLPSDFRRL
ncbi:MAG: ATP-binding protein [Alphaproteobacteria bacterium PRO2]|nr:ATP-binding protein [Alphaproteobacteria bacterium PRO2]